MPFRRRLKAAEADRHHYGTGIPALVDCGDPHRPLKMIRPGAPKGSKYLCQSLHQGSRSVITVAPQPPASNGASEKLATKGVLLRIDRTISRCTPIPRPWMIRSARKPIP